MAENKKGFILYADLVHVVSELTDKEAGLLFKHILGYVNDTDPVTDNRIVNLTFGPIKQQLKRDLLKFEQTKVKRSNAGKISAENKKVAKATNEQHNLTNSTHVESVEQGLTKSTVIVNDTVNDTVTDNVIKNTNVINSNAQETNFRFSIGKEIYAGYPSELAKSKTHLNYLQNWLAGKNITMDEFSKAFDSEFLSKSFTNDNHFQNSISKTIKDLIQTKNGNTNIKRSNPTERFTAKESAPASTSAKW